eukprot:gene25021-biopygen5980
MYICVRGAAYRHFRKHEDGGPPLSLPKKTQGVGRMAYVLMEYFPKSCGRETLYGGAEQPKAPADLWLGCGSTPGGRSAGQRRWPMIQRFPAYLGGCLRQGGGAGTVGLASSMGSSTSAGQVSRLLSMKSAQVALPDAGLGPSVCGQPTGGCRTGEDWVVNCNPWTSAGSHRECAWNTVNHGKYGGSEVTYDVQADMVSGIGAVSSENWAGV